MKTVKKAVVAVMAAVVLLTAGCTDDLVETGTKTRNGIGVVMEKLNDIACAVGDQDLCQEK